MSSPGKHIPGYRGFVPQNATESEFTSVDGVKSHIPGYAGYVPGIKPENMFGKTYGTLTYLSTMQVYPKGADVGPDLRYQSTVKDTYVNQSSMRRVQMGNVTNLGSGPTFEDVLGATNIVKDKVTKDITKKGAKPPVNVNTYERHVIDAFWGIENVKNLQPKNTEEIEMMKRQQERQYQQQIRDQMDSTVYKFWGDEPDRRKSPDGLSRTLNNLGRTGQVIPTYDEAKALSGTKTASPGDLKVKTK